MFRNQYDSDVTVWSPQGRIFQVEYAMEAVKQGACSVGLASSSTVVLCALKRSPDELASYQKKLIIIDEHIGAALSGLTADARVLGRIMMREALGSRMDAARPIPVHRLVASISDKAQLNTQQAGGRPFGVGLLIAGYDATGAHLFEFSPSGNYQEYYAMAIGARSQSARTYLEKNYESFEGLSWEELIIHGLTALRDSLPPEATLTAQNVAIGVVGKDMPFEIIEDEERLKEFVARLPSMPARHTEDTQDPIAESATGAMDVE